MSALPRLLQRVQREDTVELRPDAPHAGGMAIGLGAFALGVWATETGARQAAWIALVGVMVGMVLYLRWRVAGPGWRVDLRAARAEPVGQKGEPVSIEGRGWAVRTGPGEGFATIAIDLMHEDRGRVARLYQYTALRLRDRRRVVALADALAERLKIERLGLGA